MVSAIFLSYRRNDNAERVSRIYDWLIAHGVPPAEIFLDTDDESIPARTEFPEDIKAALLGAECVLVVIGPSWLSYRPKGRLRQPQPLASR